MRQICLNCVNDLKNDFLVSDRTDRSDSFRTSALILYAFTFVPTEPSSGRTGSLGYNHLNFYFDRV